MRASYDSREPCYSRAMIAWPHPNMQAMTNEGCETHELQLPVPPSLLCGQRYTRAMIYAIYVCRVISSPNARAMIHAIFGARDLRYTQAMIAWSFFATMRATIHASYDAREL